MKTVLIIQRQMKLYRAPLFAKLHGLLREEGIELTVAYSAPPHRETQKKDTCALPTEYGLKVKGYSFLPEGLLYQPVMRKALRSDLVIVEQANRHLLNHVLVPLSRAGLCRVAFWGHGKNGQPNRLAFSEWYRRITLNWVSWWFAYTKGTAKYLESQGVPMSRITAVQNAVDTLEIQEHLKGLTREDRKVLRSRWNIPAAAPVGIYCGVLDKSKSLPFLLEASKLLKAANPDFHLILVGAGPEQVELQKRIDGITWVHWAGPQFGKVKAELLSISDVFLLPSAVGLAILDAFAGGLPIVTTRHPAHGPEIEYLEPGINGLMTNHQPGAYAQEVTSLFAARDFLARLQLGAKASAGKYSIEDMAANFANGIQSCLGLRETIRKPLGFQRAS